ncbi:MAG: hypothetical protein V1847_04190 [Candidatus Diapherotrites archaeon]
MRKPLVMIKIRSAKGVVVLLSIIVFLVFLFIYGAYSDLASNRCPVCDRISAGECISSHFEPCTTVPIDHTMLQGVFIFSIFAELFFVSMLFKAVQRALQGL